MSTTEGRQGFTDIHSHVLFGIDDGAETYEATCRMLDDAAADGIGTIVTTPHISPGTEAFLYEEYAAAFSRAEEYIRNERLDLKLIRGHEVLYTNIAPRFLREGAAYPLGGSNAVLTEFVPDDTERRISDGLDRVTHAGFRPVLAHAERCLSLRKTEQIRRLKEAGVMIQINARTVIRRNGFFRQRYLDSLFAEELVDFIATDTHDMPGRETCMTQAYEVLSERFGQAYAIRLCRDNAAELLKL